MQVSKELTNFVYNLAFKEFRISSEGFIEPSLSLTADEFERIVRYHDHFGFPSEKKMREVINTVVRERSEGMSFQSCTELSLLNLPTGTALLVKRRRFGARLRLLYAGHRVFHVIDDNTNSLLPGDVLRVMAVGLCCGEPVYCQLFREGKQLHNENQMFYVDDIKDICFRMPGFGGEKPPKPEQRSVCSLPVIYAWKVSVNDNKAIIPYSEITENPGAVLRLELEEGTVDYNKEYDKLFYTDRGWNVSDDILAPLTDSVIPQPIVGTESKGLWRRVRDGFEVFVKMSLK